MLLASGCFLLRGLPMRTEKAVVSVIHKHEV